MSNSSSQRTRIVIIGAGFGGLQAAQSLSGADAEVLLIDRHAHHTFIPLLYQVATAQVEPTQVVYPVRTLLRGSPNVRFLMSEVHRVDFHSQIIETDHSLVSYDYLLLATGGKTTFQGVAGAARYGLPLRSIDDAIAIRNHIITRLEQATGEGNFQERQRLLTFTIVGGGATGVELAGALLEWMRGAMGRDYPELRHLPARIILLQSGDQLLPDLPKKLGKYTAKKLRRLGVEVYLQTKVERVSETGIMLSEGRFIEAGTVIWTAGQGATYPQSREAVATASKGKVCVNSSLQLLEYPNVYAIGDVAYILQNRKPLIGVAPEALQAGVQVAKNLRRQLQGKSPKPFRYFNKGRLAIIGCYTGVGYIAGVAFTGVVAWLMWLGVHFVYLPGFRNRLLLLLSWVQGYLFADRPVRLILPATQPMTKGELSISLASEQPDSGNDSV
ncbi:NAD(P)/FAD-dependent oxidoreductase [Spirulina sp. CS-785/01]|uniref:NAD(P)/FAD-dependent oxidoreductase n=1 Tax=Spirulina sp. CS-785/01 TaxID=3021716 RepID=UPI00232F304F|nr:NAD(P)/FAD-dependent oxidoreductase [Spirulina sp. CS-785/01]MDB9312115.1 NAD(P)/FAD-dependent oxidoreductase [Spirulina sp. CS-785/01]